jgi:excisionase family DNA binding protein
MTRSSDKLLASLARDHYADMIRGFVTVATAADMIGVSARRVRAFIKEKRLPATWFGRCWYLRREDVLTFKTKPRKTGHPVVHARPSKRDTRLLSTS